MTTALDPVSPPAPRAHPSGRSLTITRGLLACGILYAAFYVVVNDGIAATGYDGYRRMDQAVSELSATGSPVRGLLIAMTPLWTALMIGFGLGVWRAARDSRALKTTGAVIMAFGVTGLGWLAFPMTSRHEMVSGTAMATNDLGHIAMTVLTITLIVSQFALAAVAFGTWFRIYSAVSAAVMIVFGGLTGVLTDGIETGDPTSWMGLVERTGMAAWLLWMVVLSVMLLRRTAERLPE